MSNEKSNTQEQPEQERPDLEETRLPEGYLSFEPPTPFVLESDDQYIVKALDIKSGNGVGLLIFGVGYRGPYTIAFFCAEECPALLSHLLAFDFYPPALVGEAPIQEQLLGGVPCGKCGRETQTAYRMFEGRKVMWVCVSCLEGMEAQQQQQRRQGKRQRREKGEQA